MVKAKYIEFRCPRKNTKIFGKIIKKKIGNEIFIYGKGYFISKMYNRKYYIVYETTISKGEKSKYVSDYTYRVVFGTRNKKTAISIAKFLAKRVDLKMFKL